VKEFTDAQDRKWTITVTLGSAMAVKAALPEVDLLAPEAGEPPLLSRLISDEVLLGSVICELLRKQMEAAAVDREDILAAFDGKTLAAAQAAFFDELRSFFQSRGRTDRAAAVAKTVVVLDRVVELAQAKVEAMQPPTELQQIPGASSGRSRA